MECGGTAASSRQPGRGRLVAAMFVCALLPRAAAAQGLTGAIIGRVTDEQGQAIQGAQVRVSSAALIGSPLSLTTPASGQLRFPALPIGIYTLDVQRQQFVPYHEEHIRIGGGTTLERPITLRIAGVTESIGVEGAGSRIEARDPGFKTRFGIEDIASIPTRRSSMFDWIRAAPGISATSPSSGTTTTISAFGSGSNENQFLIDGTNTTCPCNGVARSEPGVDFIQEVQIQSVGASAEFGNVQGAVVNVITRQGSDRFLYDASYFGQPAGLTGEPVTLPVPGSQTESGYHRDRYRDATSNLGGPAIRDRLWFFGGYQYLRDYDSQPGTDPDLPRVYEQNKLFAKLTWRLAPSWQLVQSYHLERWTNSEQPTFSKPFETTLRTRGTVPAITFGVLTHTVSPNTVWDVRVGRFDYSQESRPSNGDLQATSRTDQPGNILSGGPPQFSDLALARTTGKATLTHYRAGVLRGDHQLKVGVQVERGEHRSPAVIPTGARYVYNNGQPSQKIVSDPSVTGGLFVTAGAFVSDAITIGDRVTADVGLRFDHSRAISQDLHAIDLDGTETDAVVEGLGTMYTWPVWSPRLGLTTKLTADGRTMLRASYGRFYQGVLTGEIAPFHPGSAPVTVLGYVTANSGYTRVISVTSPAQLVLDSELRAPRTDEYSAGLDREIGHATSVSLVFAHKNGQHFIGWTDIGGQYSAASRLLADGTTVPVFELVNGQNARQFQLTNPGGYSLTYNGVVVAAEKRRSHGWQAFGSYTWSRASGLQASSGTSAAGAQVSTVAPPPPPGLNFGRDPNDLTNAYGRLANDRPQMLRAMGSIDIPGTGLAVSGSFGYFSGKPWAAAAQVALPQNTLQRILIEPRGARRLPSQALLDLRVSRPVTLGRLGRVDLLLDVLNLLDATAAEGLVSDILATETVARNPDFAKANAFVDPRRVMLGVRVNLGR